MKIHTISHIQDDMRRYFPTIVPSSAGAEMICSALSSDIDVVVKVAVDGRGIAGAIKFTIYPDSNLHIFSLGSLAKGGGHSPHPGGGAAGQTQEAPSNGERHQQLCELLRGSRLRPPAEPNEEHYPFGTGLIKLQRVRYNRKKSATESSFIRPNCHAKVL